MNDQKRVFFALEVAAPWPHLPKGRCLLEQDRHLTLLFLGATAYTKLQKALSSFSVPPLSIGLTGVFDSCLFLPSRNPHVVAWHIDWWDNPQALKVLQLHILEWLTLNGIPYDSHHHDFLPHVTICRPPFIAKEWERAFHPLPMMTTNLHLYESLGGSHYKPVWSHHLLAPFIEIEHTADIAFHIHAHSLDGLYRHAQIALAFKHPSLLPYFPLSFQPIANIEEIIMSLNASIGQADAAIGCPLKAISFHDKVIEQNQILTWEMIVDV